MPFRTGPCAPWTTAADVYEFVRESTSPLEETTHDAYVADAIAVASEVLWARTGRQYTGSCTDVVRPCCSGVLAGFGAGWWARHGYPYVPTLSAGQWYNVGGPGCGCVTYDCDGSTAHVVDLAYHPVTAVTAVKIDGVALATTAYRLDGYRYLRRIDGSAWPVRQDLDRPDTDAGTWSVAITHGTAPPQSCVLAATELAAELAKATAGVKCELPRRVVAASRQGVTYQITSVNDLLDRGAVGLYYVDLAIKTWNPDGLRARPRVLRPGGVRPYRVG